MSIKDELTQSLKDAMRSKNDVQKRTVRLALAAVKNAEIDQKTELDDPAILAILQKEVKMRRETMEGAEQAGRDDLIAEAEAEIAVLEGFLPAGLTPEELEAIISETITEVGATSMREMGQVMQAVMPKVRGRADGKEVNQIVRKLLT
jgi:uncharacterized protein YqeY